MIQTNNVINSLIASNNQTSSTQTGDSILGKEDFLKLLITQLRYQDPMSPLQSEDYIAQLAQFSSLEQLQNMNDNLDTSMKSDLLMAQSISNSMVTALIGKEAKVQSDQIYLPETGESTFGYRTDQAYNSVQISIYDQNDSLVYYKDVGEVAAGEQTFNWDGRNSAGNKVSSGNYRVEVKLVNENEEESSATTFIQGEVTSVKYDSGSSTLIINGQSYDIANVVEVSNGN